MRIFVWPLGRIEEVEASPAQKYRVRSVPMAYEFLGRTIYAYDGQWVETREQAEAILNRVRNRAVAESRAQLLRLEAKIF